MILTILNELENNNSRNEKIRILNDNKDNSLLKEVFFQALNPYISFFIKKIPSYTTVDNPQMSLADALFSLNELSERKITGKKAISFLKTTLSSLCKEDAIVLERIVKKDMRCGVNVSTVNKIWNNIPVHPCLLARPQDSEGKNLKNIIYPALAQIKADGTRVNIFVVDGKVKYTSREGNEFNFNNKFDAEFMDLAKKYNNNMVFDGEIIQIKNKKLVHRKTVNGLVNKSLHNNLTLAEMDGMCIRVWDEIPHDDFKKHVYPVEYLKRLDTLTNNVQNYQHISVIETITVQNIDEAIKYYIECVEKGEEGIILKNFTGIWENKRSADQVKFKVEKEADLIVVGWNLGNEGTKREGKLGSLKCETSDGIIKVDVSGFTDELYETIMNENMWIGSIVTVRYNEIIVNTKGEYSLFLPRLIEKRFDKQVANSYAEIDGAK